MKQKSRFRITRFLSGAAVLCLTGFLAAGFVFSESEQQLSADQLEAKRLTAELEASKREIERLKQELALTKERIADLVVAVDLSEQLAHSEKGGS